MWADRVALSPRGRVVAPTLCVLIGPTRPPGTGRKTMALVYGQKKRRVAGVSEQTNPLTPATNCPDAYPVSASASTNQSVCGECQSSGLGADSSWKKNDFPFHCSCPTTHGATIHRILTNLVFARGPYITRPYVCKASWQRFSP